MAFSKTAAKIIQLCINPGSRHATPMCQSVTNFYFAPQAPILTSFADHFCSSQSKKKPQKKCFSSATKTETKLNSIVYEYHVCNVAEKLQFYTWFHVEVLMNLPSCLSCYLFLDSITLNNEWSLWAVRWFPAICDAKRFSCNFGFFAFLPSKGSSFRGMLSQHLIANVLWGVLFAISSRNSLLCIYSPASRQRLIESRTVKFKISFYAIWLST